MNQRCLSLTICEFSLLIGRCLSSAPFLVFDELVLLLNYQTLCKITNWLGKSQDQELSNGKNILGHKLACFLLIL